MGGSAVSVRAGMVFGTTAILFALLRGVHEFFQVRPEDLIFRVFEIAEVVALDCKNENTCGAEAHHEAGGEGDQSEIHRASSSRRVRASDANLARLSTAAMASCASHHTGCAGHQALRSQVAPGLMQMLRVVGPSTASTISRIEITSGEAARANPPFIPRW